MIMTNEQAKKLRKFLREKKSPKGTATVSNVYKHLPELRRVRKDSWKQYGFSFYCKEVNGYKRWIIVDNEYGTSIYDCPAIVFGY